MKDRQDINAMEFAMKLCTKLCHDMAGPISAVNNGLEFYFDVEKDPVMQEQALDLISMSAKASQFKLQMLRIAYGRADKDTESSFEEFKDIVEGYFSEGKIFIQWELAESHTGWLNNEIRQLVASMILLTAQVMVYGGRIIILLSENGKDVIVKGVGMRLKHDEEMRAIILQESDDLGVELTPYNVGTNVFVQQALKAGARITMDIDYAEQGKESEFRITCCQSPE